jgi:hypothetical protein
VGQLGNLRADCQSAQTARVNNPLQDGILPHMLKLTHYPPDRRGTHVRITAIHRK